MGALTETVVPIFGNLLAIAMLLSPIPAVLHLRKSGKLGDINPLPYPMTVMNCAGWIAYGYAVRNPMIFPANIIGFLAGMFFTLTAFICSPRSLQDRISALFVVGSGYFILLGLIACFGLSDKATARLWGTSAVVILMCYYVVPLSTMVAIVRQRNAASIYPPLAATAIANGSMWTIYGFAVQDINLWLPNLFGAIIGVLQFALRMVYGARPTAAADAVQYDTAAGSHGDEEAASTNETKPPGVDDRLDSSSNLLNPGAAVVSAAAAPSNRALGLAAAPGAAAGSSPLAAAPAGPT